MRSMVAAGPGQPLELRETDAPELLPGEVLLRVAACGMCRTDLHVLDGDLPGTRVPCVPGHEVVGVVEESSPEALAQGFRVGQCLGLPRFAGSCGYCKDCVTGRESLCEFAEFTGQTRAGGLATHVAARAEYCLHLPSDIDPVAAAPLLCAGPTAWRSLRQVGFCASTLGIHGFDLAGQVAAQIALAQGRRVFAFTRPGDTPAQRIAHALGVSWVADWTRPSPANLDAAIVFGDEGRLVTSALESIIPGGTVFVASNHLTEIPAMQQPLLAAERKLGSISAPVRGDVRDFFVWLAAHPLREFRTRTYALEHANQALMDLRVGGFDGARVIVP